MSGMTRELRAFGTHVLLFQFLCLAGMLLALVAFLAPQELTEQFLMWVAVLLCAEAAIRLLGRIERKWPRRAPDGIDE